MAFPGGINHVVHVVAKAFSTEIVTTLQVRYLRYRFLLVAYVTLEVLLVAFEELSVDLLHSPLLRLYVKAMCESFKGNMFFFLKPMLSY